MARAATSRRQSCAARRRPKSLGSTGRRMPRTSQSSTGLALPRSWSVNPPISPALARSTRLALPEGSRRTLLFHLHSLVHCIICLVGKLHIRQDGLARIVWSQLCRETCCRVDSVERVYKNRPGLVLFRSLLTLHTQLVWFETMRQSHYHSFLRVSPSSSSED